MRIDAGGRQALCGPTPTWREILPECDAAMIQIKPGAPNAHTIGGRLTAPVIAVKRSLLVSLCHAVVLIDHQSGQIVQFDAEHTRAQKVKAHTHYTRQHGSGVRTEHEFFAEVCDALTGIAEVLVTGPHTAQADFRHYVEKHRPEAARRIVGWQTVDHPTEGQLLALARKFFDKHDRMVGTKAT
jgi:hypothetical protein